MQRHCVRFGDFTLSSGRKSKYYYNGKRVMFRPSGAHLIGEALVDVVLASGAEAVGGPELGAVPIACAVGEASLSRARDLPVFVVRKAQKDYGAREFLRVRKADATKPVAKDDLATLAGADAILTATGD